MIGTGLRVGEVTGLRWCDIDMESGMIDVNHTDVYKRQIHDRVNYAVTDAKLKIAEDRSVIALNLQIDEKLCSMYDYFEIFFERMMLCRKAADRCV